MKKNIIKENLFLVCIIVFLSIVGILSAPFIEKKIYLSIDKTKNDIYIKKNKEETIKKSSVRNFFVRGNIQIRRFLGDVFINDIYLCGHGKYMEDIKRPNILMVEKEVEKIRLLESKNKVNVLLIPNAACVQKKFLPIGASPARQDKMLLNVKKLLGDEINYIDAYEELAGHNDSRIYYNTDSSLTSLGGYYCANAFLRDVGILPYSILSYNYGKVTEKYTGKYSYAGGYKKVPKEDIYVCIPKNFNRKMLLKDENGKVFRTSIFDTKKLEGDDKKKVFLGDLLPITRIETTAQNKRKLVIIKDDQADTIIPFIIPFYHEVVLIDDLQTKESVKIVEEKYREYDVLFILDANSFFAGDSLSGIENKIE